MSTNAYIAIQNSPTDFDVVYLHWDGDIRHAGQILHNNYNTMERARELVALGDLSGLYPTLDDTIAYHRNRGEDWADVMPSKEASFDELSNTAGSDYLYVLVTVGESVVWTAFKSGDSLNIIP